MKRFRMKAYLLLTLLLAVYILPGCGGDAGNGHWDQPGTGINPSAPTVMAVVPAVNATAVPINTKLITAAFSKAMDPASLTITSFTLTCDGTPITGGGAVTYLDAGFVATLPLPAATDLPGNALCTATITTAATALDGNALASTYEWTFTTALLADTTLPQVESTVPATTNPGPTLASSNPEIKAIFTEDMDPVSITAPGTMTVTEGPGNTLVDGAAIPVTYNVGTRTATFIPLNPLTDGVTYTVTIKGIGLNPATDVAFNALAGDSTLPLVANDYVWSFTTDAAIPLVPLAINLGLAESFGIASQEGLTSTGVTVVNGDVALYPLAGCTDSTGNAGAGQDCLVQTYSSPTGMTVNGSIYWAGDPFDSGATALAVTNDLNTAWIEGKNKVPTQPTVAGDQLSSVIAYLPGVYHNATLGLEAGGIATLDAENDSNAIFIFQVDSSFVDSGTLLQPTQIVLINGAQARNVWFVTGLDATIGSGSTWNGNILAGRSVTVNNGSTVMGRVLAGASGAGAFVLTGAASPSLTSITVPE